MGAARAWLAVAVVSLLGASVAQVSDPCPVPNLAEASYEELVCVLLGEA